jgi:ribonuclease BN (tRNA processing enzyme)
MKTLRGVFLTHLHSDHVIDYPNILLYGWFAGIELGASPLRVFGPGRRGEMEPVFTPPGRQAVEPQVMNPSNPTPGTVDMTEYLYQAFATDINDRMRDNGKKDLRTLVKSKTSSCLKLPGSSHRMKPRSRRCSRSRSTRTTGSACWQRLFIMPRSGRHSRTALTQMRVRSSFRATPHPAKIS